MRPRSSNPSGAVTARDRLRSIRVIRRIGRAERLPETLDVMVGEPGGADGRAHGWFIGDHAERCPIGTPEKLAYERPGTGSVEGQRFYPVRP